ncbi:MAG TPA: hypothetical protein VFW62_02995, partial [bacterium]|nr:hypothetical protein [bacterium]
MPISPAFATVSADSESLAKRMARRYLEELEPLFEGKATAFREIQKMKQAVVEQELKAELKKAFPEMRVELDLETDRYRLVAKERETLDSAPDPVRKRLAAFEERAVEELERLLDQGSEGGYVAKGLAGLDSNAAWDLRKRILDEGRASKAVVLMGLAGLDSPKAWAMRESFLSEAANEGWDPTPVALSLAGLDSPRAWEMRARVLEEKWMPGSVAAGLGGLDSKQAWELRQQLLDENVPMNQIARGLAGLDSPQAWNMRKHFLGLALAADDKSTLSSLMESLAGLDSPQAWKMRHEVLNLSLGDPAGYLLLGSIIKGLAGLDSQQAWDLRNGPLKLARANNNSFLKEDIVQSLAGLDSPEAWEMRRELFQEIDGKHAVAEGITGTYSNFVWRLRPEWQVEAKAEAPKAWASPKERLAVFESRIVEELERLEQMMERDASPFRQLLGEALAGLDSPGAWAIRERLLAEFDGSQKLDRLHNVVVGLAGLDSDRAWQLRQELHRSLDPKGTYRTGFLAESLAALESEQAWAIREQLFEATLRTKSVNLRDLDHIAIGLTGLDSERAWAMRERLRQAGASEIGIVEGLVGVDSDRAWEVRAMALNLGTDKFIPHAVATSLVGLDSDRAWAFRNILLERAIDERDAQLEMRVVASLSGLDSEDAWKLRESALRSVDPSDRQMMGKLARSLAGLDSPRAQEMRDRLVKLGIDGNLIALSLAGDNHNFTWRLRPEWQEQGDLRLLNLVHRPALPEIRKYLAEETDKGTGPKWRAR